MGPQCYQLIQFTIPESCTNLFGIVNSCVYYARHARYVKVLSYSVDFKATELDSTT